MSSALASFLLVADACSYRESLMSNPLHHRSGPLILVVDDDVTIASLLCTLLGESGFATMAAYSANEAFDLARMHLPSLILIDVMMPSISGGNGDKLVERLQEYAPTRHIPVALMSSDRPRLINMGGVPFLPKPFDIEDIEAFVERHVELAHVAAHVGDAREEL
jgi:CheY-like chemotaxis protein